MQIISGVNHLWSKPPSGRVIHGQIVHQANPPRRICPRFAKNGENYHSTINLTNICHFNLPQPMPVTCHIHRKTDETQDMLRQTGESKSQTMTVTSTDKVMRHTVCKTLIATYQFFSSRYPLNDNIEMCNTAMEGEFCELSESVRLQNVRPLINSTDQFK